MSLISLAIGIAIGAAFSSFWLSTFQKIKDKFTK